MQKESTYDLLKRWLRGDVGYKDEQQLNEHAASDPFLADALDGYRSLPGADHKEQLQGLKARLQEKQRSKKGGVYWMRIAASVLVLVVAFVAFWVINQSPEEAMTTQNEVPIDVVQGQEEEHSLAQLDETPSEAAEEVAIEEDTPISIENALPRAKPSTIPRQRKLITTDGISLDNEGQQEPIAMVEEEVLPDANLMEHDIFKDKGEVPPQKESAPIAYDDEVDAIVSKPEAKRAAPAPSSNQVIISGKVVDGNNSEPLIGANVLINGTTQGAVTDFDGNFVLPVSADTNAVELVVSYTGYAQSIVEAKAGEDVFVWLDDEGVALSEVTVTSGSRFKRNKKQKDVEAAPKKGFDEYASYLKANLNYPEAARDAGIKGSVVLSFTIGNNGRPSDIQVEKSLGYGCDAEAIRLLKEGPKWHGKGQQARYVINFKP